MYCTNPNYIHEFDFMIEYEETLESVDDSINRAMSNLIKAERKVKYAAMFENSNDTYIVEEAKKNLFERIGDGIKKLVTKFINMVKRIFKGEKQDDLKQNVAGLQQAVAEDPSLKDQLITGIKDGKYDVKDISAYMKAYEEASKLLAEGKIDPNTFKGKMQLAAKKFDEKPKMTIRLDNLNSVIYALTGGLIFKLLSERRKHSGEVSSAADRAYNRFYKMLGTKDIEGQYNTVLSAFWEATRTFLNANANEANQFDDLIVKLNQICKKFSKKTEKDREANAKKYLARSHRGDTEYRKLNELKDQLATEEKKYKEASDRLQLHENGTKILNEAQLAEVKGQLALSETIIDSFKTKILELEDMSDAERLIKQAELKTGSKNNWLYKEENSISKRKEDLDKKEKSISKRKEELDKRENRLNKMNEVLKRSTPAIDSLRRFINETRQWLRSYHSEVDLKSKKSTIETLINKYRGVKDDMERDLNSVRAIINDLEKNDPENPDIDKAKTNISKLEDDITYLDSNLNELKEQKEQINTILMKKINNNNNNNMNNNNQNNNKYNNKKNNKNNKRR